MKLNEYIHKNLMQVAASIETCWKEYPERAVTEEEIEEWIVEWYGKTFHQPNLGGVDGAAKGKPALPPLWLADWHPRIRPLHEQEACGIDEG